MSMLTIERDRKTSPARLGKIALGAVCAGVVGMLFAFPLIGPSGYAALGAGDVVSCSRVTGTVESVDGGTVTVRATDGRLVTMAVDELRE